MAISGQPPEVTKNLNFGAGFTKVSNANATDGTHTTCKRPSTLGSTDSYGFGSVHSRGSANKICVSNVSDASTIGTVTVNFWYGYVSNGLNLTPTAQSYSGWSTPTSNGQTLSTPAGTIYGYTMSLATTKAMWVSDGNGGQCLDLSKYGYDFLTPCFNASTQSPKLLYTADDRAKNSALVNYFRSDVNVVVNGTTVGVPGTLGSNSPS